MRIAGFLLFLSVSLAACSTTMTGRRQLTLIDDAKMNELGVATFASLKKEAELNRDRPTNEYVVCVAAAVLEAAPRTHGPPDNRWEVLVFEDPAPNAFALPGGKIGVNAGMLEVAITPGQLAAVLGHEVAHVLLRHGNERMSQSIVADTALNTVSAAASVGSPRYHDMVLRGLGVGAQFGVLLPFSRKHESEADEVGQMFMARAGFDPAEAVALWQSMAGSSGEQQAQWQSTHPSDETRIARLQASLPRAMKEYRRARASGKRPRCEPPPDEWINPEALP